MGMCGIAGIYSNKTSIDQGELIAIRDMMAARGPDASGIWFNEGNTIALGHRRLSITDLSDSANQPMLSHDGRFVLVFNGEIYNHHELRDSLKDSGVKFRTHSDTEVVLQMYALKGSAMLNELRGMFAIAIWDNLENKLFLARDQFGIKPLYYAKTSNNFYFASQVKALLKAKEISNEKSPAGEIGFYLWGHVPEPHTYYRDIFALPAGSFVEVDASGVVLIKTYFSLRDEIISLENCHSSKGWNPGSQGSFASALKDSVQHHLLADVPVACFLSAGLDSTTLALMAGNDTDLHTLTLGFEEYRDTEKDEVPMSSRMAHEFGWKHQVSWFEKQKAMDNFESFLTAMDQPTIDGLNIYFVSQMAREAGFKVALSGLGGDELLGGYDHFAWLNKIYKYSSKFSFLGNLSRKILHLPLSAAKKPIKYASFAEYSNDLSGAYFVRRALNMPWQLEDKFDKDWLAQGLRGLDTLEELRKSVKGIESPKLKITALEMQWYMRNQLLRDADWAGMAHSVEIRVPFLDVPLLRQTLPISSFLSKNKQQILQQEIKSLPKYLTERKKTGFFVPIRQWYLDSIMSSGRLSEIYAWQEFLGSS